ATFLRSLAYSKQWKKSWYMVLFQLPGADYLVRRRDLALIDRLWRAWSPSFTLDSARRDELHACLKRSLPAPLEYYRAIVRPRTTRSRSPTGDRHTAVSRLTQREKSDGSRPGSSADASDEVQVTERFPQSLNRAKSNGAS